MPLLEAAVPRDYSELMSLWDFSAGGDEPAAPDDFMLINRQARMHAYLTGRMEDSVAILHEQANAVLQGQLLSRIHSLPFQFFEKLTIDVLLAIGLGVRRRDLSKCLGKSGDGGIDGVVSQDDLGLDVIYVQAKRIKPANAVPISDVRDFAGSLDAHHATKGIFVTTGHFSSSARSFIEAISRRVVLIDGARLTELMIRYNLGVVVSESFQIKRMNDAYFSGPQLNAQALN